MEFFRLDDIQHREVVPGCRMRAVHSEGMTVTYWNLDEGAVIPDHGHPHEQVSTVIQGEIEITVDGETRRLTPGQGVVIPSDARHSIVARMESFVVDVFCPVREDYR